MSLSNSVAHPTLKIIDKRQSLTIINYMVEIGGQHTEVEYASRRAVLPALSGLLLGSFVAILSNTIVSSSLPRIVSDLGGGQPAYTWVVTASLLATAVGAPLWGKLADLVDRKMLVQVALAIFVVGSAACGAAQDMGMLIAFRAVQGVGVGGLMALGQILIADLISPRERGRYMGITGGVTAVATMGGPLVGGLLTDTLGWRWDFYAGVPFAIAAAIVLQSTLRLPEKPKRAVSVDYLGAALITVTASLFLVWITMAGAQFAWGSALSRTLVAATVVLLVLTVVVELRVKEPILPMTLFRNRTFVLAIVATLAVGAGMYVVAIYLAQYLQIARGFSPTESGLFTLPGAAGILVSSIVFGGLVSRSGKWKRYLVAGTCCLTTGILALGTIGPDTSYWLLVLFQAIVGLGIGMTTQNLVLVVQNAVPVHNLGAGTSAVSFFRTIGGTVGVAALGAFFGPRVSDLMRSGLAGLDPSVRHSAGEALSSGHVPDLSALPGSVRAVVEHAYGSGAGDVFLLAGPFMLVAVLCVVLLPNLPLSRQTARERMADRGAQPAIAQETAVAQSAESATRPRQRTQGITRTAVIGGTGYAGQQCRLVDAGARDGLG